MSGGPATLKMARKLIAAVGSFVLAPQDATLAKSTWYSWIRYATVSDYNFNGSSSITATFNTDGSVSFTTSLGDEGSLYTDMTHWHDGGNVTNIGSSRWAKKTSSGDPTSGTLTSTLVALSSSKTITIQAVAGAGEELIEIYSDSGGTTKVGQIALTISATI